jgi:hypothetical protein
MALVNQAEFARLMDVSRKTVTTWKASNLLVLAGGLVDVEASKKVLKKYRRDGAPAVTSTTVAARKKSAPGNSAGNAKKAAPGNTPATQKTPRKRPPPKPDTLEFEAEQELSLRGAKLTLNEARRLKENYLALLRELEYQEKTGSLVDLDLVKRVLFEEHRAQRDAWLNWPARVGPLIAAEFDLEADKLVGALNEHVHKHITQLGEPPLDLTAEQD